MASLLVGLYAVEGIVRIPTTHHMALQFRPGAPLLLEKLFHRQQEKGDIEVALLTSHTDFFGPKLLEPITKKYPSFHMIADCSGPSGRYVLEKHWREIAMQKNCQHSLRLLIAGPPKGVNRIWNSKETLILDPFVAYDKRERKAQRVDEKVQAEKSEANRANPSTTTSAGKKTKEDNTMRNFGFFIDDALSAPETPINEVLSTSAWVNSAHFALVGDTYVCVSD